MDHADQKYIDALFNNDERLLREIYQKFSNKITKMILQQGGDETDAADIIQDALLSIFHRAKTGDFKLTCPFEGFLHLICKRKWTKELKRRNKLKITIAGEDPPDVNDPSAELAEECIMYEDQKALTEMMLQRMGDTCRKLLYLSWEGRSMDAVAAILNISYGYARKKKTECMAKLISLIHQSPEYKSLKQ